MTRTKYLIIYGVSKQNVDCVSDEIQRKKRRVKKIYNN